ncbi:MAG TPA: ABC transporter permease subunit [bacterium]|nr:ABC transporter permease subunit [bacterium]
MIRAAWSWVRGAGGDREAQSRSQETGAWVRAVYWKETLEAFRDRRSLLVLVVLPALIMPVVTLGIPYLEQRQAHLIKTTTPQVAIQGNAPNLIHLAYTTKLVTPVRTGDPVQALKARRVLAVLELPKNFEALVARDSQPHAGVLYDASNPESVAARARVVDLISRYSQEVVARRLIARRINPKDLLPVVLDERNVATQRQLSGLLLASLLPFFIAMWAVVGGMSLAVDQAAGEKERGTLESLLVTPPSREAVVVGKFLSVLTASVGAVIVVVIAMMVSLRWGYPYILHSTEKLDVSLPVGTAIVMLGVATLFAALMSAVQLAMSIYAKSPREAQQFITPLYFVTVLPALAVQYITEWQGAAWAYLLPILNTFFGFRELLLGTTNWGHLLLASVSSAFYAALAIELAIVMMSRESVIFRT